MTRLILIRHGESKSNRKSIFTGQTDVGLTDVGYKQADLAAKYIFDNFDVDVIYASDLSRAYDTAKAYAKLKSMDIIKSEKLREINAGDWEGNTYDFLLEKYKDDYDKWKTRIGLAEPENGESTKELSKRIVAEITRIAEENKGKTILIATHATPIRCYKAHIMGVEVERMHEIPWSLNASVTVVDYENRKIEIDSMADYLGEIKTYLKGNV